MGEAIPKPLREALDRQVEMTLDEGGAFGPPIDAILLARTLGFGVIVDARQEPRGRQLRISGRASIFIQPDDRPERRQWAVAHELGEALAGDILAEAGFRPIDCDGAIREQVANLAAARILLPSGWFFDDARGQSCDVPRLKERYRTASHELIALRLLDLPIPSVVTVFDQGRLTRRVSNLNRKLPALDRLEQGCWLEAHRFNRSRFVEFDGRRVQAWPIHEPGWKREILRTTALEED